ncbi:MAG: hypothetical protein GX557_06205, partial [Chloroflexi bacterium]|nr:hypothetical protein [Chloroflexota bacterium]
MNKLRNVGLAVAVAATIGLAGGGLALAQGPVETPETSITVPGIGHGMRGGMRGGALAGMRGYGLGSDAQLAAMAELLGITPDALTEALQGGASLADLAEEHDVDLQALYDAAQTAREDDRLAAIEQRVTDGTLSREQADWLIEGITQDYAVRNLTRWGARGDISEMHTALAAALGLSVDNLSLQRWGGRSLADLAEAAGVDVEQVEAALEQARDEALRTRIADALAAGEIEQAEADWLIAGLDNDYVGSGQAMPALGEHAGRGAERAAGGNRGGRGGRGMSAPRSPACTDEGDTTVTSTLAA